MCKYKFFILFVVSVLSGCTAYDGYLSVYSDLDLVRNKTVYYEVTDSSVIASRINRVVKKILEKKGWRVVPKGKANYVYTVSANEKEHRELRTYLHSNEFGTFGGTYMVSSYFPRVFITIADASKKENVYEAVVVLSSSFEKKDIYRFLEMKKIQGSMFGSTDVSNDVLCQWEYNEKTSRFDADCEFVEY